MSTIKFFIVDILFPKGLIHQKHPNGSLSNYHFVYIHNVFVLCATMLHSTFLVKGSSLDTHIHRSLNAQQRRPCRYFRLEIRRLYPRTPKLHLSAIQFLRRLAQRQVAFLRRMSQNPQLLYLQSQRP